MSLALEERPSVLESGGNGGGPARRAIYLWAWRLFRREWRQQVLVLALVALAVAATVVGVAFGYNAAHSADSTFGAANSLMTFDGSGRADVTAARQAFGTIEEIAHTSIAIPGSLDKVDVRAQDPNGKFGHPMLRLVTGRYPTGAGEIALTRAAATSFNVQVGGRLVDNGHARTVVGLVENPFDLNDNFALVAPGQITSPTQVTILFNASPQKVMDFRPTGNATGIGTRGALNQTAAAAAILAVETISLLFVGLVSAAGFAVMAQRRLRALGMLGALGATDRHVRLAMVANGVVAGVVGSVIGAVVGLMSWIVLAPQIEKLAKHRIDVFHLPWWAIGMAVALAVLTAVAAAWWPARSAARASIVTALSGRPAPPKPAHRFAGAGGVMLLAGFACLAFADRTKPNAYLIIAGTVTTTFGMLFLGPLFIRAIAVVGRRAPIALRLALRDLARYQARSAAALGAISLALAIAATVAVSAAALAAPRSTANLPTNEILVYLDNSNNAVFVEGAAGVPVRTAAQTQAVQTKVGALAATLHAVAIPLTQAVNPASGTFSLDQSGPRGSGLSIRHKGPASASSSAGGIDVKVPVQLARVTTIHRGGHTGIELTGTVPLYIATPALLRHYGINTTDINANTDIVTARTDTKGLVVTAPRGGPAAPRGPYEWQPTIQLAKLPTYTSDPGTLLTTHALRAFGLKPISAGWLIQTPHPLTASQINTAQRAASGAGIAIATHRGEASYAKLRNGATAIGILVALGILAMTVGLIRSETANDLRTLAATGATSTTRRTLTGATAGALALLGALLGTGGAYLALIAWHRSDLHPLTHVPIANLVVIIVGLPLIAVTAGWLLAGREPSTIAHQPLD
ncbi:MAG: hypothetical protein JWL83_3161 [Actinomycetia bacterium]|nr:hypothetical protein [Actinomycetes bacterium]